MPSNNREDFNTTYSEMSLSAETLEDLRCLLDTYSDNLQEKFLLLAVVTHSPMTAQDIEYFEFLLPCGRRIQFVNTGKHDLPFVPGDPPQFLH
ncbi:hypothetical protein RDV39_004756 [Salmonella enterica]|nr:hypothetical protein [Salmonella enterica]